jgi:predicted  nucleic acid-binding Zn-ribbon protein
MGKLHELYSYQEIRLRLQKVDQAQSALVSDTSIAQAMEQLSRVTAFLASHEETVSSLKSEIKSLENEICEVQFHCKSCESRLYDGSVSQPKELEQLQNKIEEYRKAILINEDKIIAKMEALEVNEEAIHPIRSEEINLNKTLKELEEDYHQKNMGYEQTIKELEQEACKIKESISPELLKLFEQMARVHHGVALAPIEGECCGACHVAIPLSIRRKVGKEETVLVHCENCGRIIFKR